MLPAKHATSCQKTKSRLIYNIYLCWGTSGAHLVESVPHVQRLCPYCSGPQFNSDLWLFAAWLPLSLSLSLNPVSCHASPDLSNKAMTRAVRKEILAFIFLSALPSPFFFFNSLWDNILCVCIYMCHFGWFIYFIISFCTIWYCWVGIASGTW